MCVCMYIHIHIYMCVYIYTVKLNSNLFPRCFVCFSWVILCICVFVVFVFHVCFKLPAVKSTL